MSQASLGLLGWQDLEEQERVQGLELHSEFEGSLGYVRPCQKEGWEGGGGETFISPGFLAENVHVTSCLSPATMTFQL